MERWEKREEEGRLEGEKERLKGDRMRAGEEGYKQRDIR